MQVILASGNKSVTRLRLDLNPLFLKNYGACISFRCPNGRVGNRFVSPPVNRRYLPGMGLTG